MTQFLSGHLSPKKCHWDIKMFSDFPWILIHTQRKRLIQTEWDSILFYMEPTPLN